MKITKIIGLERSGKIISEPDFEQHCILSTKASIEEYFEKYGYAYVEPYDLSQDLIIVQDKNFEVSMLLGMFYKAYRIINYKTCEVVESKVMPDGFTYHRSTTILSFTHRIIHGDTGVKLVRIADGEVMMTADSMQFIDSSLALFRKCNIEYIIDLETYEIFPLIKQEVSVYQGPHPENMVDFRHGMYYQNQKCLIPVDIAHINIDYLITNFPLGEKRERFFYLLNAPIKYGISYDDGTVSEIWYETEDERDDVYDSIHNQVIDIFNQEKQKQLQK